MTDATADIIYHFLLDQAIGGLPDATQWPIFVGNLPDQPDEAICCYDTAGRIDGRMMRTGEQIEHPGIQVIVRSQDFIAARNKAHAISDAFDEQMETVVQIDSSLYTLQNISRTGAVLPLGIGEDDRRRHHFSINSITTIREEPAGMDIRVTEEGDTRVTEEGDTRVFEQ